uniref:Uncharacterized protein n=1 Tax=Salix viminalis TaxID=40686 RepID=A0A6N2LCW7_SALVM
MATAKLTIPAITCDCTVDDGDAPFWLSAPSYTIVLLTSGLIRAFCGKRGQDVKQHHFTWVKSRTPGQGDTNSRSHVTCPSCRQYCGDPKASQALLQATLPPSVLVTLSSEGHEPFKSTTHPPSSLNSANVAGGAAPVPEHSSFPEPQSPVAQENFPVESSEQYVRPQKRPPHEAGAEMGKPSCRESWCVCVGKNSWPYCVVTLVCKCKRC